MSWPGPVERIIADRTDATRFARVLSTLDADCVVDVTAYRADETRIAIDAFRNRVRRFIHISTLSVYRWPFPCPVAEDWPLEEDPFNHYGFHKAGCERAILSEPVKGLPWTILRLPAVFGPRDPFSREARLCRQIIEETPVVVPIEPFLCQNLYVRDAARAVRLLIESPQTAGQACNAWRSPFHARGLRAAPGTVPGAAAPDDEGLRAGARAKRRRSAKDPVFFRRRSRSRHAADPQRGRIRAGLRTACHPRHRNGEFRAFLQQLDRTTPAGLDLHLIVDNYGTHTHLRVKAWLRPHPRFHLHFTPTSSSWLNLVERWFRDLTTDRLRRGSFGSVTDLIAAIRAYLDNHNQNPQVFVWSAPVDRILTKIAKCKEALDAVH